MSDNKFLHNAKWIIGCKIVQSLIQFVVGILSARYLGPSNYGLINYASSVIAFFLPIMQLGLSSTLVQEYVTAPKREGEIVGTQLAMTIVSALACMVGVFAFVSIAHPGDQTTILVCVLYSVTLVFQATELLQYWFQAKLMSKYSSVAMLCAYTAMSAYRIFLLVTEKSVFWFAISHAVEYFVASVFLFVSYRNHGTQKISFSFPLAKKLFAKSRHYILPALMVVLYNSIANVLIIQICGETENGYFAAANTCVMIVHFVYMAVVDTMRPIILENHRDSFNLFERNLSRMYSFTTWVAILQSFVFVVCAGLIVKILYGEAYLPAIPVLQILIWNRPFSYMGHVRNIWILGEEKHTELWKINLGGAVASLILNLLLIPTWGACGAAVASVLVQIFTNVIMGYILKPIRRNNYLILRGLNPKLAVDLVKTFLAR